jgi:peptidoglycan/LPS O-acetylase OafA/YrhL
MSGAVAREPGRLGTLDALRGVAAFLVLTFHCWNTGLFPDLASVWGWRLLTWTPLNLLIAGRPWVILFFVLSGFVLARSLERATVFDYRGFVLRRLCRIYLPFVVSILLSLTLYALVQPRSIPALTVWFNNHAWSRDPTPLMLTQHLFMTGLVGEDSLNPVMWSLVYELRISLLFPLLFLAAYRWPCVTLSAGIAVYLAAGWLVGCRDVQCQPFRGDTYVESALLTAYFALFFIIGILLARWQEPVRQRLHALAGPARILLGIGAVYAMIIPNVPKLMWLAPADPLFGLGAAVMIMLAINGGAVHAVLERQPLAWLGKVSYSLYLTHNIVLLAVIHTLFGRVGATMLLTVVVAACLLVAGLSWWLVEAPAMWLGRVVSRRWHYRRQ